MMLDSFFPLLMAKGYIFDCITMVDFPGFARHSKELKCNSKSGLKSLMSANTLKVGKNQMRFLSHNLPRLNGVLHSQVFVLH